MVTRTTSILTAALGGFAILAPLGCQDLIGLTAGKTGNPSTGGGGVTSAGGTSSSGGATTGGTGGSTTSTVATGGTGATTTATSTSTGATTATDCGKDCVSTECRTAVCANGECLFENLASGEVIANPKKGDCKADRCDEKGMLVLGAAYDEDFDDSEECTWDACGAGLSGHLLKREGTHCAKGVCNKDGKCVENTGKCNDGKASPEETGIDCGGPCKPCPNTTACKVAADCQTGFCATNVCRDKVALAVTGKGGLLAFSVLTPGAVPEWSVPVVDMTVYPSLGLAAISFDAAGEGVAVFRQSTTGGRSARWTSALGGFGPTGQWLMNGDAGAGSAWTPTFAKTDLALYLFAQNSNLEHELATAGLNSGGPFVPVDGASSPLSGAASTRQGHASFFYPDGNKRLVELRFLDGKWSDALLVATGNYQDATPSATVIDIGTLIVAARRDGSDHLLDWILLRDDGPPLIGEIPAPKFVSPAPPPRRLALSARSDGGAILAFRDAAGNLSIWTAESDPMTGLVWSNKTQGLSGISISVDPAVAPGIQAAVGNAKAELMWVTTGANGAARHSRLGADGNWSTITDVVPGAGTTLAIATP